jgi:hypothetical protein
MIFIYLDPGSGSFLIQLLIAAVAGLTIVLAASWSKIKRLFHKNKTQEGNNDEDEDENEED